MSPLVAIRPERVTGRSPAGISGWCFPVWVQPGASREAVAGVHGDALKVSVSAPPERGKANRALRKLLAEALRIRTSDVHILKGETSRRKVVLVERVSDQALARFLAGFSREKGG